MAKQGYVKGEPIRFLDTELRYIRADKRFGVTTKTYVVNCNYAKIPITPWIFKVETTGDVEILISDDIATEINLQIPSKCLHVFRGRLEKVNADGILSFEFSTRYESFSDIVVKESVIDGNELIVLNE